MLQPGDHEDRPVDTIANVSMNCEPNHSTRMPAVFARIIAAAMRKDGELSDRDILNILRFLYCTNEQRRAASQQTGMTNR
jgi:hypothetical protein